MVLSADELSELYEAIIKPFGHPDPLGYMTRALIESGGDPDYIGVDGRRGFMPVLPELALELTGAQEVQSLQSNVIATLTMDRLYFDKFKSIDDMIIAFHYGEDALEGPLDSIQTEFLTDVNDSREEARILMYPPFATVDDVIKLLDDSNVDDRLTTAEAHFFEQLLKG